MFEVLRMRLANHHLGTQTLEQPSDLVAHLGAVQAQDYGAAKWAVGLRLRGASNARIDAAFDRGDILRTHVLRPTWHFVVPTDIRWLLKLTGPRVKRVMASYTRTAGIDQRVVADSQKAMAHALEQRHCLTKTELMSALGGAGISVSSNVHMSHLLGHAELDGLICSGPRRGREHTYMLLEERVPAAPVPEGDEALRELTWRYFSSHGPALVTDCVWWSSLSSKEVSRGLDLNRERLESTTFDARMYWFAPSSSASLAETIHLLPNFDEYTVAYRHRDLYYDADLNRTGNERLDVPFANIILLRGRVAGRWKRLQGRVEHDWSIEPSPSEVRGLERAHDRYRAFW